MSFNTSYILNPEIATRIVNDSLDMLNAQEMFSGISNTTYAFDNVMRGFVISNDSDADLTFEINGYVFEVKAGEVFENTFKPFMSVTVNAQGAFRAFGKGMQGEAHSQSEHKIFPDGKTGTVSTSGTYKGTGFQMMADRKILFVGANGSPVDFEIWEMEVVNGVSKIKSPTALATGNFSTERDDEGYLIGELDTPLEVGISKMYLLHVHYTTTETTNFLRTSTDTGNVDNVIRANGYYTSSDTGILMKGSVVGKSFYYDFKIGVETL